VPVPLCSIEEQREIVSRYQSVVNIIDTLTRRIEGVADRVQLSSQAILSKAFRSELPLEVPA